MSGGPALLAGRRLLLVKDDFFLADDLANGLAARGAVVVGSAATVDDALDLVDAGRIDGAVLDINLGGEQAYPVADALMRRGVPFVFTTGYDQAVIPARFGGVARCEKPVDPARVERALFG